MTEELFVDEAGLVAFIDDSMERAAEAHPDSAKIDVLWAALKTLREKYGGKDGRPAAH